jgi:hypothetical protein
LNFGFAAVVRALVGESQLVRQPKEPLSVIAEVRRPSVDFGDGSCFEVSLDVAHELLDVQEFVFDLLVHGLSPFLSMSMIFF